MNNDNSSNMNDNDINVEKVCNSNDDDKLNKDLSNMNIASRSSDRNCFILFESSRRPITMLSYTSRDYHNLK